MIAVSELGERQRLVVRRDLSAVREILRRIKHTEQLVALNLFDRRKSVQSLDSLERRANNHASVELPIYVMPVDFDGRHTHNMEEAEKLCQSIAIIHKGNIVRMGHRDHVLKDKSLESVFLEATEE